MSSTIICFLMAAINIPFIFIEEAFWPIHLAAAVYGFGLGIAFAIKGI